MDDRIRFHGSHFSLNELFLVHTHTTPPLPQPTTTRLGTSTGEPASRLSPPHRVLLSFLMIHGRLQKQNDHANGCNPKKKKMQCASLCKSLLTRQRGTGGCQKVLSDARIGNFNAGREAGILVVSETAKGSSNDVANHGPPLHRLADPPPTFQRVLLGKREGGRAWGVAPAVWSRYQAARHATQLVL